MTGLGSSPPFRLVLLLVILDELDLCDEPYCATSARHYLPSESEHLELTPRSGHVNCVHQPIALCVQSYTLQPTLDPCCRPIVEAAEPTVEDGGVVCVGFAVLVRVAHAVDHLLEGGQVIVADKVVDLRIPFALTWLKGQSVVASVARSASSLCWESQKDEYGEEEFMR